MSSVLENIYHYRDTGTWDTIPTKNAPIGNSYPVSSAGFHLRECEDILDGCTDEEYDEQIEEETLLDVESPQWNNGGKRLGKPSSNSVSRMITNHFVKAYVTVYMDIGEDDFVHVSIDVHTKSIRRKSNISRTECMKRIESIAKLRLYVAKRLESLGLSSGESMRRESELWDMYPIEEQSSCYYSTKDRYKHASIRAFKGVGSKCNYTVR